MKTVRKELPWFCVPDYFAQFLPSRFPSSPTCRDPGRACDQLP